VLVARHRTVGAVGEAVRENVRRLKYGAPTSDLSYHSEECTP
jgi:hypothetical protein